MKRTRNGILIPDVPIMAGGNLPNAVKGMAGTSNIAPNLLPYYINVHTVIHINEGEGLEISTDAKDWRPITTETLTKGRYYFRAIADGNAGIKPNISIVEGELYDVGGNIASLATINYITKQGKITFNGSFLSGQNIVSAKNLYLYPRIFKLGYSSLFKNCSNLTIAPTILVNYIDSGCLGMFENCISLKYIRCLNEYENTNMYDGWVRGLSTSGTFLKKRGINWPVGISGIPNGWNIIELD